MTALSPKRGFERFKERPCRGCGRCVRACAFLSEYGTPKEILELGEKEPEKLLRIAYHCSLCGLCTAICKDGCDPPRDFLNLRRNAVVAENADLTPYKAVLSYEALGVSRPFTWAHLPSGCRTLFFPGCGISGTRPEKVIAIWNYLRKGEPSTGIVLDCCTKPSHDLGRQEVFERAFGELYSWIIKMAIEKIVVACPNCFKVFSQYGTGLEVVSIYEIMAEDHEVKPMQMDGSRYLHHPCATRFEAEVQKAAAALLARSGASLNPGAQKGKQTLCCGEGGAVEAVCANYPHAWRKAIALRKKEQEAITYCSGCASRVGSSDGPSHILDLYFNKESRDARSSRWPMTYVNRLILKRRVKKLSEVAVTRQRHVVMGKTLWQRIVGWILDRRNPS
ncbi:MAG: (Fe-S)-binding protein [Desulfobacterales bacterium]|nr:(Fe-S)-binding protein [Desulfobacterales bacterium]